MNDLLGRKARTQVFPRRRPYFTCADQENLSDGIEHGQRFVVSFHARIQEIFSGGGGSLVQARRPENRLDLFFVLLFLWLICYCFFLVLNLFYLQFTEGVKWFYYRDSYTFPRIQRDSNIFKGGGGPNANFF